MLKFTKHKKFLNAQARPIIFIFIVIYNNVCGAEDQMKLGDWRQSDRLIYIQREQLYDDDDGSVMIACCVDISDQWSAHADAYADTRTRYPLHF